MFTDFDKICTVENIWDWDNWIKFVHPVPAGKSLGAWFYILLCTCCLTYRYQTCPDNLSSVSKDFYGVKHCFIPDQPVGSCLLLSGIYALLCDFLVQMCDLKTVMISNAYVCRYASSHEYYLFYSPLCIFHYFLLILVFE